MPTNIFNIDTEISGKLTVSGTSDFIISSTGNVGIGTSSPTSTLQVDGQVLISATAPLLDFVDTNSFTDVNDRFRVRAGGNEGLIQWYDDSASSLLSIMTFQPNGNVIVPNGNVGIGTTSPDQNLHVSGASSVFQLTDTNKTANNSLWIQALSQTSWGIGTADNASSGTKITISDGGNVGIGTTAPGAKLDVKGNGRFYSAVGANDDVRTGIAHYDTTAQAANVGGQLVLGYIYHDNGSETEGAIIKMYKLNSTSGDYSSGLKFQVRESGVALSTKMTLNPSGNLGIGTTSPGDKLHVLSSTNTVARFETSLTSDMAIELKNSQGSMFFGLGGGEEFAIGTDADLNGANSKFVVKPSGNVGIGTTSPDLKLHVAHSDGNNGLLLEHTSQSSGFQILQNIRETEGLIWQKWTNGVFASNLMTLDYSGNVGIGTTSPKVKLNIAGGDVQLDNGQMLSFYTGAVANVQNNGIKGSDTDDSLRFYTGASERVTIKAGNVGIGTTSPDYNLDVENLSGETWIRANSATSSDVGYRFARNGVNKWGIYNQGSSDDFEIYQNSATASRLRITSTGNVGIGTTSPTYKLHVSGNAYINETLFVNQLTTIEDSLIVYDNVGIGTTSPQSKLDVRLADGTYVRATNSTNNVSSGNYWGFGLYEGTALSAAFRIVRDGTGNQVSIGTHNNQSFAFWQNATERMRIDVGGNVGIGTTDPSSILHISASSPILTISNTDTSIVDEQVIGQIDFKSLDASSNMTAVFGSIRTEAEGTLDNGVNDGGKMVFSTFKQSTSLVDQMVIDRDGNVGIGTTSPEGKLDVEGGALGNTSGDSTTAAIIRAGRQNLIFKDTRTADGTDWNNATFKVIAAIDTTSHQSIDFVNDGSYSEHIDLRVGNQAFSTRFASNGNVGIGTTSPDAKLAVNSTGIAATPTISLTNTSSDGFNHTINAFAPNLTAGENNVFIIGKEGNTKNAGYIGYTWNADADNSNVLTFGHWASDNLMNLTGDGNLGIGTTSPSEKLEVVGTIKAGVAGDASANIPALLVAASGVGNEQASIAIQQETAEGDTIIFADYEPYVEWGISTENNANLIQFTGGTNTNSLGSKNLRNNAGDARTAYIKFQHDLSNGETLIGGNVGIGTTSPNAKLEVNVASGDGILIKSADVATIKMKGSGGVYDWGLATTNLAVHDFGIYKSNASGGDPISAGTAQLYFKSTGSTTTNVGIGTTSPSQKLSVAGNIALVSNNSFISFNTSASSGDPKIQMGSDGDFSFQNTAGSTSLHIENGGNVGIGTTSPVTGLDVRTSAYSNTTARFGETRPVYLINADPIIGFNQYYDNGWKAGTAGWSGNIGLTNNGDIYFSTSNTSVAANAATTNNKRMTILNNGNVGIGTDGPGAVLTVGTQSTGASGAGVAQDNSIVARFGASNQAGRVMGLTVANTATATVDNVAALSFIVAGNYSATGIISTVLKSTTTAGTDMVFSLYNDSMGEKMRITSTGNVGIGTDSPGLALEVSSNATSAEIIRARYNASYYTDYGANNINFTGPSQTFQIRNNGSAALYISSSSNVGIGTTSPTDKLEISDGRIRISNTVSGRSATIGLDDNYNFYIKNPGAGNLYLGTGTTTLVSGNLNVDGGTLYVNASNDNVGIGTTSPGYKLDVSGTIRATGDVIAFSDARVKENVETIPNALDKVKAMRGVGYNKIGEEKRSVGVIAQELLEVLPEAVHQDDEGMYSVAYGNVVGVLIEAIKDLTSEVESLKALIDNK